MPVLALYRTAPGAGAGDGVFLTSLIEFGIQEELITAIDIDFKATAALVAKFSKIRILTGEFLNISAQHDEATYD